MSSIGLSQRHQIITKLDQKLVITPQLQQAIKLLQLNHMELAELLQEELLENPVLELAENNEEREPIVEANSAEAAERNEEGSNEAGDGKEGETAGTEAADQAAQEAASDAAEGQAAQDDDPFNDIDWDAYFEDTDLKGSTLPSSGGDFDPDMPTLESRLTLETSLTQHLEWQLHMMRLSQDAQQMAVLIIGHLDKHGWLVIEDQETEDPLFVLAEQMVEEEARATGAVWTEEERAARKAHWHSCAKEGLAAVHEMEPAGVGARSLEECLLLQCRQLDSIEDPDLVDRLIRDHLQDIERKNYASIGKKIKVCLEELLSSAQAIGQLDPYPSRGFNTDHPAYISPDIYIKKIGDEYVVSLNDDGLPKLKINNYYKQMLKDKNKGREFVQEKLRNATWLLRSIHQRQRTIFKVTESIIERQKEFLERGLQHLKPMILRDVAEDIGMHESTISRVTTNKYVHTPQGVFELKFFFTSSLPSSHGGEDVSSLTVKEKIKHLVAGEDPKNPLSDQEIVKILKGEGIRIARRTVAKYRSILNIAPSNRRKQPY